MRRILNSSSSGIGTPSGIKPAEVITPAAVSTGEKTPVSLCTPQSLDVLERTIKTEILLTTAERIFVHPQKQPMRKTLSVITLNMDSRESSRIAGNGKQELR